MVISRKLVLALISYLFFCTFVIAKKNEVLNLSVGINSVTYNKYIHYMHSNVCDIMPDLTKDQVDRAMLEIFLMCLAFENQSVKIEVIFVPVSNYLRSIRLVQQGLVHTLSESVWSKDITGEDLLSTIDVIRFGEFEKGIYAYENHPLLLHKPDLLKINQYVGITFKSWIHDWNIIASLTKKRKELGHLPSLFQMLKSQRGDFTLMEFPLSPDLSIEENGIVLKPVKGIKVQMPDSRRFIIATKAKNSQKIFTVLNRGLINLRKQKKIKVLYQKTGFINEQVKEWKVIAMIK